MHLNQLHLAIAPLSILQLNISYLGLSVRARANFREMCSYERFMKERFERCLDLYLPPSNRNKLKMIPDDLLLNVPSRETLKPYPEILSQEYHSLATKVNAISVHHSGELLACSTSSGRIIIWEVHTGKSIKQFDFEFAPTHISWHPTKAEGLMTVLGNCVIVMDSLKVENVIITCWDRALKTITWRNEKHYCLLHHTSTVNGLFGTQRVAISVLCLEINEIYLYIVSSKTNHKHRSLSTMGQ